MAEKVEIWKDIDEIKGHQISNMGNVRSFLRNKNGKLRKPQPNKIWGYYYITYNKKGYRVHRLVAKAFLENPDNKPEVNHKNGIKTDNRVENLEWVTASENSMHGYKIGIHKPSYGNTKISKEDYIDILFLRTQNMKPKQIAKEYNVHYTTILNILKKIG